MWLSGRLLLHSAPFGMGHLQAILAVEAAIRAIGPNADVLRKKSLCPPNTTGG